MPKMRAIRAFRYPSNTARAVGDEFYVANAAHARALTMTRLAEEMTDDNASPPEMIPPPSVLIVPVKRKRGRPKGSKSGAHSRRTYKTRDLVAE